MLLTIFILAGHLFNATSYSNVFHGGFQGPLGFHGLWVGQFLAIGFQDLRLIRTGFQVLTCVTGCEFGHFSCLGIGYFIQNSYFSAFQSHTGNIAT